MSDPSLYTIGWICAIASEFVAAQLFLDEEHEDPASVSQHDCNSYKLGRIGKHNIVIAVLPHAEYGLNSAAIVARDMLHTFENVKIGLMVGIGGGAPSSSNDIRLGDIVVSSPGDGHGGVFQYDFGKSLEGGKFHTTGFLNKPPTALMTALNSLISDIDIKGNRFEDEIKKALRSKTLRQKYGRPDPESDKLFRSEIAYDVGKATTDHGSESFVRRPKRDEGEDPAIHYGLIASANQVMKDACKRDALAAEKNVLCFEMEAAGLMNHFPCLVIRGICDYSDSHKNKQWQGYAAMAAAAYAKALVCRLQQSRLEHERRILEIPQVLSLLENVKQGVFEIKTRVDHTILGELSIAAGAEYDTHHNEHDPTCHPETRVEIIQEIENWARDAAGPRIYWLSGIAGTGKSTIARTVARKFDDMHMLAASFFFKRGEADRSRASLLFSTIARQLVSHRHELLPFVLEAIRETENISSKSTREQFNKLIIDPLAKARSGQRGEPKMRLVMDALDECSVEKDIETVVPLLAALVKCEGYDIKVFVTSRPETAINCAFDRTKGLHEEIQLHRVSHDTIASDITVFLRDELAEIKQAWNVRYSKYPSRHLSADWPGNESLEALVRLTNPLFIFAATACRFIQDRCYGDPDEQLSTLLRASKESGVNEKLAPTYLPALRQFRDDRTGLEKERLLLRFQQIVGTIILLEESLSIVSIAALIGVEEREVERILGLLGSVLDVPEDPNSPVTLFHLSFREFLLGPGAEDFAIEYTAAHRRIALGCLDLLSNRQPLQYNMCGIKPGDHRSSLSQKAVQTQLPWHVRYACVHLVHHMEQAKMEVRDDDEFHRFIKVHLLHWLEALSILGQAGRAICLADILVRAVEVRKEVFKSVNYSVDPLTNKFWKPTSRNVLDFLEDSDSFVLNHISTFSQYPLQLYWSALSFSPTASLVRQTFRDCIPKCITFQTSHETSWCPLIRSMIPESSPKMEPKALRVTSLALSPDSSLVAGGYNYDMIQVWSMSTGEPLHRIFLDTDRNNGGQDQFSFVQSLVFSGDSKHLISTSSEGVCFHIHKTECGSLEQILSNMDENVCHIDASLNGDMFASAHGTGTAALWSMSAGKRIQLLLPPANITAETSERSRYGCVGFSADSRFVAAAFFGHDETCVWDTATGHLVRTIQRNKPSTPKYNLRVFISSSLVPAAWECEGKVLSIFDVGTGQSLTKLHLENKERMPSVACISPDYKYLAYETTEGRKIIRLLDSGCHYRTLDFPYNDEGARGFGPSKLDTVFSRDGKFLVHSSGNVIHIWSMAMLEKWSSGPVDGVQSQDEASNVVRCSIHRKIPEHLLISVGNYGTIKLWSLRTGQMVRTFKHSLETSTRFLEFSPGLDHMFTLDGDDCRLWRASDLKCTSLPEENSSREHLATSSTSSLALELVVKLAFDHVSSNRWKRETVQSQFDLKDPSLSVTSLNRRATSNPDALFSYNASWLHGIKRMMIDFSDVLNRNDVLPIQEMRYATAISSDFRLISFAVLLVGREWGSIVSIDQYDLGEYDEHYLYGNLGTDAEIPIMALSPDLSSIVTLDHPRFTDKTTIRIWSIPPGQCVYVAEVKELLSSVAFSPDVRSVLTERGSFRIPDSVLAKQEKVRQASTPSVINNPQWYGYGFDEDARWITWNGLNIISLPGAAAVRHVSPRTEDGWNPYAAAQSAVCEFFVAWIDKSSRLWMTGFCPTETPFS